MNPDPFTGLAEPFHLPLLTGGEGLCCTERVRLGLRGDPAITERVGEGSDDLVGVVFGPCVLLVCLRYPQQPLRVSLRER